jgi:hypothetical protein
VPDVSQKPRVIKRESRDPLKEYAHRPASGYYVDEREALEKILERVLADVRDIRGVAAVNRPRTKTREAVPALVTLIFQVFPVE